MSAETSVAFNLIGIAFAVVILINAARNDQPGFTIVGALLLALNTFLLLDNLGALS
ncbi:MAG TPA: hypothetical protein VJ782_02170 [Aeromicrobium sp.]|nr:hypothetical protein [Aeromicrobium sp.]